MNSKLFSRIAAFVLCVVMLGTVSFAAPAAELDTNKDQFTITNDNEYIEANEQMTMMAYTVPDTVADVANIPEYSDQMIIAVDQKAASSGSFGTVKFNKNRITADKKVAVVLSGTAGTPLKMLLSTEDIHLVKNVTEGVETLATSDAIDLTVNDVLKTYKDVKVFGCSYEPSANTVIKKVNFNLVSSKAGSTPVDVEVSNEFLDGEATYTFKLALIGLPERYFGDNPTYEITATPSVDYEGNVDYLGN